MLKHYNLRVDKVVIVVVACYVLHNYSLKWGALELGPPNLVALQNNLQRFGDILLIVKEGKIAKVKGEKLKLFGLNNG